MSNRLSLYVPSLAELWYRQSIMKDPETMSYNKGYDMSFDGYDKETGCIAFPKEEWEDWYNYFVGNEPECFYAYIVRNEDNAFIGEVNVHKNNKMPWYDMGIVIEAKYRGHKYAVEGLLLLLDYAFNKLHAEAVHNDFEIHREAALHTHMSVGFKEYKRENEIVELLITQEEWKNLKR